LNLFAEIAATTPTPHRYIAFTRPAGRRVQPWLTAQYASRLAVLVSGGRYAFVAWINIAWLVA
jgi:hypothetical protein